MKYEDNGSRVLQVWKGRAQVQGVPSMGKEGEKSGAPH